MSRFNVFLILVILSVVMLFSRLALAKKDCPSNDPAIKLIELSNSFKKEMIRSQLRLDWNGTSVTVEQYEKLMERNKDHYTEDPNLRRP